MAIPLLDAIDIEGKVITADALLTQKELADYLVQKRKAHYHFTVKGNQPTLLADIEFYFRDRQQPDHIDYTPPDHGRIEIRKIWTTTELNDYLNFPHVGQAFVIERESIDKKTGKYSKDVAYGITSRTPEQANAQRVLETNRSHWSIGVSRKGRIIQSVKVRPRLTDSRPRSLEGAAARKQGGKALRQHSLKGGCATYQVVTYSERRCSLVTRNPVAETVDNARRQQETTVMGHIRCFSPAGYQRRHGTKDYAETGEALDARRRNLDEEFRPITLMGKWREWRQGGGSGCTTVDLRAAKHAGREGPGPVVIPFWQSEARVR